jgi:hypothetical protein
MTFRTTFPFRTPKSQGVRNGLHDGKQDVRKGWYETSFTQIFDYITYVENVDFRDQQFKLYQMMLKNAGTLHRIEYTRYAAWVVIYEILFYISSETIKKEIIDCAPATHHICFITRCNYSLLLSCFCLSFIE